MRSDQWIDGGDCSFCRRRVYCSDKCRENKKRTDREVRGLIAGAMRRNPSIAAAMKITEETLRKTEK